ncbi:diguanylate cyclase [Methylomonas sp. LL1]|uniref:diguanylate cyclase n=1 Tax=Methylomonas sp. LL1 TaxID=2785785 RepID=UPI0018C40619|nr:diguanylate cyclase [Methylomonas sp. LL1]QPK65194.1 diguanylate cyclase [Methylomonas sp. LL1]
MDYRFTDLVDIEAFRGMLKSFYQATGILHGLVDADNNIISAIGWQEACTDFHRTNPCSNARCLESNNYLSEHLGEGSFVGSACGNGLIDYATPIVIEGRQLATLYFGQLLHEPPDMEFFRRQAQECGFDEESYLTAIRKVPVVPRERIEPIMAFYVQLARMLAENGLTRLRQHEAEQRLADLNRELAQRVDQRTAELAAKNSQLSAEVAERQWTEDALRASQTQLQAILDSSPVGVGWSRADGKVEYINQKFTELFGYEMEDIPTVEDWYRLAYPDEKFRNEVVANWAGRVAAARDAGTKSPTLEAPIVCKDGSIRYVIITVSWVGGRRLVNFSDITDRWLAEQRDHERNSTLELIATGAPLQQILNDIVCGVEAEDHGMICSILLLDRDGRHLRTGAAPSLPDFYNQAVDGLEIGDGVGSCGTAAFTKQRVVVADIKTHPYWAPYTALAAQAELESCWSEPVLSSKGRLLGTFAIYHRQPQEPDDGDLQRIGYAANLASIAIEHHQAQDELERQAHTDFLTELANRRYFIELAEAELARALRYRKPFSLLMFDIDHFKAVNDNHGHKTGDRVLQRFAAILRRTLREVDIIGRLGGEEFAVILPETDVGEAREAAERLRLAAADTIMQSEAGALLRVTVSIGVAPLTGEPTDIETLLKQADDALYLAKNSGRNQVRMASETVWHARANISTNYMKLAWHEDYECGHARIDEQHRALFHRANDLLAAILSESPADRVIAMIEGLMADISQHFKTEEAIFSEIDLPGSRKHAASHRQLAERANVLLNRFREGSLAIGELFQFLVHELIAEHILKEDRAFFRIRADSVKPKSR